MMECKGFHTRSRDAPGWTVEEMLALVSNVAAVDDDSTNSYFSSHQKWQMVADGVRRPASQCRRMWDSLIAQYHAIKASSSSYWSLDDKSKDHLGLPRSFDRDLYSLIDDVINVTDKKHTRSKPRHHHLPDKDGKGHHEGDPDQLVSAADDEDAFIRTVVPDCKEVGQIKGKNAGENTSKKVAEVAAHLQESVGQIEAVLMGEFSKDAGGCSNPSDLPKFDEKANFTRHQADQLIRIYASLDADLQHLNELMKKGVPS